MPNSHPKSFQIPQQTSRVLSEPKTLGRLKILAVKQKQTQTHISAGSKTEMLMAVRSSEQTHIGFRSHGGTKCFLFRPSSDCCAQHGSSKGATQRVHPSGLVGTSIYQKLCRFRVAITGCEEKSCEASMPGSLSTCVS